MESRVGRMGSSFYVLYGAEETRMAYLWERALHTDMPNAPKRQRLEFYAIYNDALWEEMFRDCVTVLSRFVRFQEYVHDGDITLRRLTKTPSDRVNLLVFDGEQIVIDTPPASAGLCDLSSTGTEFPKSLTWSNLIVKENRDRLT